VTDDIDLNRDGDQILATYRDDAASSVDSEPYSDDKSLEAAFDRHSKPDYTLSTGISG
jgi:hypothetical protein